MTTKTIRVYEVLYYAGDDGPSGPAGDGSFIERFRSKADAERFAAGRTYYGRPAKVESVDAPRRLAQRWGGGVMARRTVAELKSEVEALKARLLHATARDSVRTPSDAAALVREHIDAVDLEQEHFWVLLLNARQKVIKRVLVAVGTVSQVDTHPRDIFREAIRLNAHSIILAHNHPSEDPDPSNADIELTSRMVEVGKLVGIPVLDHVIVTGGDFCSLAAPGLL